MNIPSYEDLKGTKFGKVERGILLSCPHPGALIGTRLISPQKDPVNQKVIRRAARKLESLGLIRVELLKNAVKVSDPRLAEPIYQEGAFFIRKEPARVQRVTRMVGWLAEFGAGLLDAYRDELQGRSAIRWKESRYLEAAHFAETHPVSSSSWALSRDETARVLAVEPEISSELIATKPKIVGDNLIRWGLAVRRARADLGHVGSARLWEKAIELFQSEQTDDDLMLKGPARGDHSAGKTSKPQILRGGLNLR